MDMKGKAYLKQLECLQKKIASMIAEDEGGEEEEQEGATEEAGTEMASEMEQPEKMEEDGMDMSDDGEMSEEDLKAYLRKGMKKPMKKKGSMTVAIAMKPSMKG